MRLTSCGNRIHHRSGVSGLVGKCSGDTQKGRQMVETDDEDLQTSGRRTVEVYIDDIVVKSKTQEEHVLHLQEVFHLLRKYDMKLNPSKCAFWRKCWQILGIYAPHRQARRARTFIARFIDELRPFFLAIRKARASGWTDICQSAFEKIKHCLMQSPILSSSLLEEKLYMYLAVSEWAISTVLFRCPSPKEQKPIYYCAQKLRPYFQAHPVVVLTDQPLRNILHKSNLTGRMLQWATELSEYGIEFQPSLSSARNQVKKSGGLCGSMEPPVIRIRSRPPAAVPTGEHLEQAIRLGSPPLTMKWSMRPSYPDWTSPWLYPSPGSRSIVIPNSWPLTFAQWGMDIVGPLPAAAAQKKFLLVATDYFSKWVEVEAYCHGLSRSLSSCGT
ncbi:hypothetical protein CK203_107573 [Vitis vinifera]|uniref:Reverse transcriptase domain-containing protein n=1 Tax=Vitis vinifera TaxID=29760 RepID=A0A438DC39_VITVI|nr:hypothetical protein CK203_107573 [Vitis vinifera]